MRLLVLQTNCASCDQRADMTQRRPAQDALAALAPCTPSILVLDEGCARFGALAQQLSSVRHIVTLGALIESVAMQCGECRAECQGWQLQDGRAF